MAPVGVSGNVSSGSSAAGVGALRRVVERDGAEHRQRGGDGDDRDGGDADDEGGATAAAGEGRHASLPYRPRSAMTCSTGSVTR